MKNGRIVGVGAALLVAVVAGSANATIQFSDGGFDTATWVTETISAGGTFAASQSLGTGNGEPSRHLEISTGSNVGDTVAIFSRYGNTTATRYDPLVFGAISSIELQMDYKMVSSSLVGSGPDLYFGIKQGNVIYRASLGAAVTPNVWTEFLHVGFTPADFVRADGGVGTLDFSATAAPIRFGFVSVQSNAGEAFTTATEYDNFCVYVDNVPAPGAAALLGVAGGFVSRRRRR